MKTETTEQNINQAIDWLQKTGGAIQDFAVEQAPLYCREVIQYEILTSGIWVGVALIMMIVGAPLLWRGCKQDDVAYGGPGILLTIASALLLVFYSNGLIKAIVAPRVVIVEHLKNLKQ